MASSEMAAHVARLYREIYAVVRRIPTGRVATYGQIAELAGLPGGARVAGAALKINRPENRVPWQRVVGKAGKNRGRIAIHDPVGAAIQRQLLSDEGVPIGDTGLIALDRYGWLPGESRRRAPRKAKPARKKRAARRADG
ncbi:MAG TPA: MGMT family protein [Kofleriaceae bacterium]|nr:MGMT family protein [Kofleriaceae bacterium]